MEESTLTRFLNLTALPEGFVLRDLVLEQRIGKGGFGVVYRARRGNKLFAVKLPILEVNSSDERTREAARRELPRVDREISSLKSLKHPNIVSVTEFFSWDPQSDELGGADGLPIIVMPFIDGPPVDVWVARNSPPLRDILRGLRDVASALGEVHKRDFVHRDLKPSNVLVGSDGQPVLIDFGIARSRNSMTMTAKGDLIGTAEFLAPEYVLHCYTRDFKAGKPFQYGPQQDLYALGHTYYLVLTGVSAWATYRDVIQSEVSIEFVEVLKKGVIPPPSKLNPAVPAEVDAIILKLLERSPNDRYQSGRELVEALDEVIDGHVDSSEWNTPFTFPPVEERDRRLQQSSDDLLSSLLEGDEQGTDEGNADEDQPSKTQFRLADTLAPPAPTESLRPPRLAAGSRSQPSPAIGVTASGAAPSQTHSRIVKVSAVEEFHEPTGAQGAASFVSPEEDPAPTSSRVAHAAAALPSSIIRMGDRLAASREGSRSRIPIAALAVVGLLATALIVTAALKSNPTVDQATKPHSLIESSDAEQKRAERVAVAPPLVARPVEPVADSPAIAADPAPAKRTQATRPQSSDAKSVDEIINREYSGKRPVLPSAGVAPTTEAPQPAFAIRAVGGQTSSPLLGPKKWGVPIGSEITARLMKPLDTRVAQGIVVARLSRPFALRGDLVFPTGTMIYGQASQSSGRFDVKMARIKLPDGVEVPFAGIAYDSSDKKPGLYPSRRITSSAAQGPGIAEQVLGVGAKALLGKVGGNDAADVARAAGEKVLTGQPSNTTSNSQEALLLDAPSDFTIFVTEAF